MDESKWLPGAFEAMFYCPEVITIIDSFMKSIYVLDPIPTPIALKDSFKAPDGFLFVYVNICGRAVALILPESAVAGKNASSGDDTSCSCGKGSGCSKATKKAGVVYCVGAKTCSKCSLTIADDSKIAKYVTECYQY